MTIPEKNAITFGRRADRGAPFSASDGTQYLSCLLLPIQLVGEPQPDSSKAGQVFLTLVTLAPTPPLQWWGQPSSLFLSPLARSGLVELVSFRGPFLQPLTPPPLSQGTRHGAPLTIDPKARWGREGPGSLWAPPWLPKGRALQQQGLESDGRRYSCGVLEGGRRREPPISWGGGRSASPAPCRVSGCQIQGGRGGGGQGVPPRPLPTRLAGGGRRGNLGSSGPPL